MIEITRTDAGPSGAPFPPQTTELMGEAGAPWGIEHPATAPPPQTTTATEEQETNETGVVMIPIASIKVVNPRERNKRKFREIVTNISDVGIKKPITVRPRPDGGYDLVCGQGRLEAFKMLGQTSVPAIVRRVSEEDSLLMSLVENIARRRPTTMETIRGLADLRDRGYSANDIGRKTGIAPNHVVEFLHLYDHGEDRLLGAVQAGRIPISAAIIIARAENGDVQNALTEAMQEKQLTVTELNRAKRIADTRKAFGKSRPRVGGKVPPVTSESLVRAFRREQDRQRQALKKAELCSARLVFAASAVRALFRDDNFVNLLRAEGLETVPEFLAEQIRKDVNNG